MATYISGTIVGQPVAADNYLAVGTLEGDISSLNARTGKLLQTIGIGEPITAPLTAFEYLGARDIVIDNDNLSTSIAIGTQSGKLYCYDLSSFGYLWESNAAKAEIQTKPIYKENKLMYLDNAGYMYCLDSRSGKMIWKWSNKNLTPASSYANPVSNGDDIFVSPSAKSLAAVDILLGKSDWFKENLAGEFAINLSRDSTKIIISSNANKFYILSSKDGKIIKELDPVCRIDSVVCPAVEINGSIISGSSEGKIFQIDKDFNQKPLLFIGNTEILSIQRLNKTNIIAVTKNGSIFVFENQQ
jgi:outer membrane protein assembly factor BamB